MRPARHWLRACSNSSRASAARTGARRHVRRCGAAARGRRAPRPRPPPRLLRLARQRLGLRDLRPAVPGLDAHDARVRSGAAHLDDAALDAHLDARAALRRLLVRDREPRADDPHLDAARRDDERSPRPVRDVARDPPARQHQLQRRRRPVAHLDARPRLQLQARTVDQRHRQRVGRGLQLRPLPRRRDRTPRPASRSRRPRAHDDDRRRRARTAAAPAHAQPRPRRHAEPTPTPVPTARSTRASDRSTRT